MRKYSKKGLEKRREERKDFPAFFQKHIAEIKSTKARCAECGDRLFGDVSEVAHILEKSKFKSISTDDENVIYLCGWKSKNNCHGKFDNSSNEVVQEMKIYQDLLPVVRLLKEKIDEKVNYKFYDKWQV